MQVQESFDCNFFSGQLLFIFCNFVRMVVFIQDVVLFFRDGIVPNINKYQVVIRKSVIQIVCVSSKSSQHIPYSINVSKLKKK